MLLGLGWSQNHRLRRIVRELSAYASMTVVRDYFILMPVKCVIPSGELEIAIGK